MAGDGSSLLGRLLFQILLARSRRRQLVEQPGLGGELEAYDRWDLIHRSTCR